MGEWEQWENNEAGRLAGMMTTDPNCAANELRMEMQQIPANRAIELVHKTQADQAYYPGSAGVLYDQPIAQGACGGGQDNITIQTGRGPIEVGSVQTPGRPCEVPQPCAPYGQMPNWQLPHIDINFGGHVNGHIDYHHEERPVYQQHHERNCW